MGKPFKIILSALVALVLLLLATVCILPFVINPNDFKPEIAAAVKEKTGRELSLDGELKLSLFPWVGISVGKIALSNAGGFSGQPFATIATGDIRIDLLPLLSKKIVVSRIILDGLVLNLSKNKQGVANWVDLARPAKTGAAPAGNADIQGGQPSPATALAAFAIGGISIENAHINWDNFETEKHIEISGLNLFTDKFTFDEPVGINVAFTAMDSAFKPTLAVKFGAELSVNEKLDNFVLRHSAGQAQISGNTAPGNPVTAEMTIADVALDLNLQTVKIYGLQLKSGDMAILAKLAGSDIIDKPSFQGSVAIGPFSPIKFMRQLDITIPALPDANANALNTLSINFDMAATANSVELQNMEMSLDGSQIKGSVGIKDFARPAISFLLGIDWLGADRYLPATDKPSKTIATPALAIAAVAYAIPIGTLRKLNAEGAVSLGKLNIKTLSMQDINMNVSAKNGLIILQPSIKQFYQGTYFGVLRMNVLGNKPTLTTNEKIDLVQIGPLLTDYTGKSRMGGIVNAALQLQGEGKNLEELKTSLSGQISFLLKDGVIKGFNLQKIIDEGKALINRSALPTDSKDDQTLFSEMGGTATLTNGLIQNNDLVAKSTKLRVDGKGSLDLNSLALDYKINAKLSNADDGTNAGEEASNAAGPEQIKGAITINMAGTLDNPSYTIDIASLLTDKNKAKIEKLIDKIDSKLGPGVGNLLKNFLK